ncbi:hypothetical protein Pla175_15150 [Pirellulimonas nuda]|uniref:DUF4440 domain-containing protein n=1 Tax=Pirellulimonas nuda TaxID=2528009 RepID=A0A518D9I3_9BACT|nr:hypothetical protein [Pirellulimonas nuda]QDU88144.1 hypothetical protein Pla175_15150 [Pirellulimonas nuda]
MLDVFLESPVPALALGAVAATVAGLIYSANKSGMALAALVGVLLLTIAAVLTELAIETPHEQVVRTLSELFAAIEADDLPAVLAMVDPAASNVRSDAQTLMPEFHIETANANLREVTLTGSPPDTAVAQLKPFVLAAHRRSGMRGGGQDDLSVTLRRVDGRWLISDYSGSEVWQRGASELRRGK